MSKGRTERIAHEYRDSDGYWIELRPGWRVLDEISHTIVEDTRCEARLRARAAVPCACQECIKLMMQA